MKLAWLLAFACLPGLALAQSPPKPTRGRAPVRVEPPEIRGMALPLHSRDPAHDYGAALKELPALGVNTVCVLVHFYQPNGNSYGPARHPLKTPSDRVVLRVLRAARKLKLDVALLPIVLLEKPGNDDWRGNLRPPDARGRVRTHKDYGKPNWARWFRSYRREIVHFARLAQEGGASLFSVGSELSSTETQAREWKQVIRAVRDVFAGELTYSANWDHYQRVPFWKDLDYIGLSAYYELTRSKTPTQKELNRAWVKVRDRILAWRKKRKLTRRPLLFTELGYPSLDGCAKQPWDYTLKTPIDLREQRQCYQAFAHAWRGRPELVGVFAYEWWGKGGPKDRGYTPRGKPALEVLRRFYGAKR